MDTGELNSELNEGIGDLLQNIGNKITRLSSYKEIPKNVSELSDLLCNFIHEGGGIFSSQPPGGGLKSVSKQTADIVSGNITSFGHGGIFLFTANFDEPSLEEPFKDRFKFKVPTSKRSVSFAIFYPFDIIEFMKKSNFPNKGAELRKYIIFLSIGESINERLIENFVNIFLQTKTIKLI